LNGVDASFVLVTGANGFVGSALCKTLQVRGIPARGAVRRDAGAGQFAVGNLDGNTDWRAALAGCDVVVHLAARVHVMDDNAGDPLAAYRVVNLDATVNLARQAHAQGVRRFVFVSSVKVNGEATHGQPYRADATPAPCDPYGVSKMEAEAALLAFGRESGLEIVIVRPPLVYGPGVKANFLNLIKLVQLGLPLPFGLAKGLRSMVALDNLVDLLILCTTHPQAPGGIFLVSDGRDLTVRELVESIASAMGKKVLMLPVPPALMRGGARLVGKSGVADRLLGSLQVDIVNTRERLQWTPLVTAQAAIDATVAHYMVAKGLKN
jgi:nucleoside-diphosphate-sugar epimerase